MIEILRRSLVMLFAVTVAITVLYIGYCVGNVLFNDFFEQEEKQNEQKKKKLTESSKAQSENT